MFVWFKSKSMTWLQVKSWHNDLDLNYFHIHTHDHKQNFYRISSNQIRLHRLNNKLGIISRKAIVKNSGPGLTCDFPPPRPRRINIRAAKVWGGGDAAVNTKKYPLDKPLRPPPHTHLGTLGEGAGPRKNQRKTMKIKVIYKIRLKIQLKRQDYFRTALKTNLIWKM